MVNLSNLNPFAYTVKATTEITDLRIHPIKSCHGISLKSSLLTLKGLELDRNWMFIDTTKYEFATIREISELTLIDTAFATPTSETADGSEDDLHLIVSIRDKPEARIQIPARPTREWLEENTKLQDVKIWKDTTDGWVYKDEYNQIFCDFLQKPLALVYKGPGDRIATRNSSKAELGRQQNVNFPDVLPIQMASEQSMKELNTRLKAKGNDEITINRFRPNIIFKGDEDKVSAWSEDSWRVVRIVDGSPPEGSLLSFGPSTITIDVMARCARCQVPNVCPETAEKNKHEPWDTLVSYRRIDPGIKWKPCFGMLCCPRNEGTVAVGMKVEVLELTDKHRYDPGK